MIPFIFSFMVFTASSCSLLSASVSSSGLNGIITSFPGITHSSNFLNPFIIATIALSPNNLITLFACICINILFAAACVYACVFLLFITSDYFIISCIFFFTHVLLFMNYCRCLLTIFRDFPSMLGCNHSTPVTYFYLIVLIKSFSSTS